MEENVKESDGHMVRVRVLFGSRTEQEIEMFQVSGSDKYELIYGEEHLRTKDRGIFESVRKLIIENMGNEILGFLIREEKK